MSRFSPMSCPSRLSQRFAAFALITLLAACAGEKDINAGYVERPVSEIYNAGLDQMLDGQYEAAAKTFDEVDRQHPYSKWATKAQLMAGYAHFQSHHYDDAVATLDTFIQLHPGNPDTPYAYYLKALCSYQQIADVRRDQKITHDALLGFQEVVTRFPETRYARDARLKIDLTRDHVAGKEMDVGRFYMAQKDYLAAVNRFKVVINEYQTTSQVPEALYRLTEAYTILGLGGEAKKTAAVLGHNYPGNQWYADAFALVAEKNFDPNAVDQGMSNPTASAAGGPEGKNNKAWWSPLTRWF